MKGIDKMIDAAVLVIILVLAVIPLIQQAVGSLNSDYGVVATIAGSFTVLLALGGLVYIASSFKSGL